MSVSQREASERSALDHAFGKRYALREKLGAGAFGVVFRARDTMLERDVAIKQVRLDTFADKTQAAQLRKRTAREAKMAAKLRHRGIVTIYDIVQTEISTLIIMELVDGVTLESRLGERERLNFEDVCDLVAQTAEALDYAHERGVVHRDIKPGNVMIEADGSVKITDFGSAKPPAGSAAKFNITEAGTIVGTPWYMSPEQVLGEPVVDGRCDVFSLACVIYECLTGMRPFRGNEVVDVLSHIVDGEPDDVDYESLQVHPGVGPVLTRALAKNADERFRTAGELVEALRRIPAYDSLPAGDPSTSLVVTNRGASPSASFHVDVQGSLAEHSIANIVRDIHVDGKTGILHLQRDVLSKRLYFLKGSIVFANSDLESDRLGPFLIRGDVIDDAMNERALAMMQETRRRFGQTLVALGYVDEEKLDELINAQIRQIILSVFSWDTGEYGFENIASPVEDDIAVELETGEILLEGVRRMTSESAIQRAIGSSDRILQPVDGAGADSASITLTSAERFVLSSVDGSTSVAYLAEISPLSEEQMLRCIYGLMSAGLVGLRDAGRETTARVKIGAKPDPPIEEAPPEPPSAVANDDALLLEIKTKNTAFEQATLYEILGVTRADGPRAIKKAYYALAKRYHPDRHQSSTSLDLKQELETIHRKLTEAYEVLSNPSTRSSYDEGGLADADPLDTPTAQLSPNMTAEAKYRTGQAYFLDKHYLEAVLHLREAVRLAPDGHRYHKALARALSKIPKWRKQAESHFLRVLEVEPHDLECYLELAGIYEESGLRTRAREMYEHVVTLDPEHRAAREKLARASGARKSTLPPPVIGKPHATAH